MLVKCSECGGQVAKHAFSCPNCGAHDPSKSGSKFLKIFFGTVGLIFISFIIFMSLASASEPESKEITLAKQEIQKEQKVVDLYYNPNAEIEWHIGVLDDGSKRHGFASYICDILHEHRLVSQNTSVRIVDVSKIKRGNNFREASLGRINCMTYEHHDP